MTEIEPAALKVVRHRAVLPEDQRQAEVADEAEAELQKPLGVLEQALRGREYLLGGGFTVADLDVQSVLWVPVVLGKCDISAYPSTKGWLDRGRARPAYLRAMSGRR
jgi:glutathione S-transferase